MDASSSSRPLVLRRGHEVTPWPWVKLRLARAEIEALTSLIDVWNLEHPTKLSGVIEDEGRRLVFAVSETPCPPLMQWSAHLGMAVSSMRAALDSIAWQAAHLNGTAPLKPKRLYFPALDSGDTRAWEEWDSNVPNMSDELRARFHAAANIVNGIANPALKVLSELNNIDKHRSSLVLTPLSDGGSLRANVDLGGQRSESASMQIHPLLALGSPMEVGTPVFAFEWEHVFESVETSTEIETAPWVNIALDGEPESLAPVIPVLWGLHSHFHAVLELICEGWISGDQRENE
ncbi:hypothetical protein [Leucobacter chironomi]|uniref:hypothetical protein n=1 Tax=Leucobacter chironomi TaxID=491918 RepID=UPI00126972FE|nr:hypothetical protein [Leucobacter chironomi]